MWIRQKRAALGGLAMAVTAFGFAAPSLAADTVPADTEPTSPESAVVIVGNEAHSDDGGVVSCDAYFGDAELIEEAELGELGDLEDGEWELAEINAETDDLVAFLAENGVSVEVETDDLGFRFPAFDEDTDEAVFDLVDEFFAERYGDEGWLIDEAELAEFEDGECYFDHDADHDHDHDHDHVELEFSDDELAELAEEFDLEVEELAELIDLLIG